MTISSACQRTPLTSFASEAVLSLSELRMLSGGVNMLLSMQKLCFALTTVQLVALLARLSRAAADQSLPHKWLPTC